MKYGLTIIKLLLTVILVYIALRNVNFSGMRSSIFSTLGFIAVGLCTLLVVIQTAIGGYRLKPVLYLFTYNIKGSMGVGLWFLGNFFSQFLISFIGGDAMRVVAINKAGVRYGTATRAIFLDRVVGFVALQALFIIGLPLLLPLIHDKSVYYSILALAGLSSCMIVGFFIMGLMPKDFTKNKIVTKLLDISSISRYLYESKRQTIQIVVLSVLVHICSFIAIFMLVHLFGNSISLQNSFIIGAPVVLLSMLPISVGGWGVRESSMIVGLGLVGIEADVALLVSIIIGLSFVIGSLPGAIFLLIKNTAIKVDNTLHADYR